MVLSPNLSGLCMAIFAALWGVTIIYGSYSRHSQRVVQVRRAELSRIWQHMHMLHDGDGRAGAAEGRGFCGVGGLSWWGLTYHMRLGPGSWSDRVPSNDE